MTGRGAEAAYKKGRSRGEAEHRVEDRRHYEWLGAAGARQGKVPQGHMRE